MDNIQDKNSMILLAENEKDLLATTIASANKIVITAHKSPDGDAVGSTLAYTAATVWHTSPIAADWAGDSGGYGLGK